VIRKEPISAREVEVAPLDFGEGGASASVHKGERKSEKMLSQDSRADERRRVDGT